MTDLEQKPRLRFKGFTEAWEQRKLDQVASYRNGKAHENSIDSEGVYIVVNSKFVSTDGEVIKKSNEQIEPLFKNELAFVLSDVPNGRAIARTFLVPKDGLYTLNQRIAGITPSSDTCPYFLYILMNRNKYFLAFDDGAKQTNLSVKDVLEFEANYPNFKEQERIGALFDSLDVLITLHQRKYEKLKSMKAALLEKIFPSENETTPKIRFKGFTEAWEQRKLIDETSVITKQTGFDYSSTIKPALVTEKNNDNYPFIQNKDFDGKNINYNTDFYIPISVARKFPKITLDSPSLLITISGKIGNIGYFNDKTIAFIGGAVGICKLKKDNGSFITYSLLSKRGQRYFNSLVKASSHANITVEDIRNIEYLCPSDNNEELKIVKLFDNIDNLITLHQRKCEKLKNLKKSLLERMFI